MNSTPDEDDRAAVAALFARDQDTTEKHADQDDAEPDEDREHAREFAKALFSHHTN